MPLGPKRAPGLYEVPVSKGAPVKKSSQLTEWDNLPNRYKPVHISRHNTDLSLKRSKHTDERNVIFLLVAGKTWKVRQPPERGDAREDSVRLPGREVSQLRRTFLQMMILLPSIPEYRHPQAACCTTDSCAAQQWAFGHDCRGQWPGQPEQRKTALRRSSCLQCRRLNPERENTKDDGL